MKSIALCLVYDMLSFYFIGLLHKIENDCKHSILTVCAWPFFHVIRTNPHLFFCSELAPGPAVTDLDY